MLNDLYVLVQIYQDLFSLCIIDIKYLFMLCLYVCYISFRKINETQNRHTSVLKYSE